MATYVEQIFLSKTETDIEMWWDSDSLIDYIWYSVDDGTNWTGVAIAEDYNGTYTITGLSPDTTYTVKTKARDKETQDVVVSDPEDVTTHGYPYASVMPDFEIGNKVTISLYNPLYRDVLVNLIADDDTVVSSDTTSAQSITGFAGTNVVNALYNSIPSAQSGIYKVRVTYAGHVSTQSGGHYSVNANECAPTLDTVTYEDSNSTTVALTGNNQDIVRNKSTVIFYATNLSAKKGASIASCSVSVNGADTSMTISGSNATGNAGTINSGSPIEATVTVTDSRGLTGEKNITVNMLDWSDPTAIVTLQRQDNHETATELKCDADYASINGNNQITITYEATKEGDSSPSITGNLTDNVTATINLDNQYAWQVEVTLTDSLGGTSTYTAYVSKGMPIIFFDRLRSSVGVNCFPSQDGALEVDGILIVGGKKLVFNSNNTVTWTNA